MQYSFRTYEEFGTAERERLRLVAESVRAFCKKEVAPHVRKWDREATFPRDLFRKLGAQGFMGVLVPTTYGGQGLGYHEYVTIISEIAAVDSSLGLSVAAHNSLCVGHILGEGSEAQKKKFLPALASGAHMGAWGLTEANSGSDSSGMGTTAVERVNGWLLNGSKTFTTHGASGEVLVILAKTEGQDKKNISAFILERGMKGLKVGRKEDKLGMRASETAEVIMEDCLVPHENLIGKAGEGFHQAMNVLKGGRISIAALALGISMGAFTHAVDYAKTREQFNVPIASFQGISFKLSDMLVDIEASRALILEASERKNKGLAVDRLSSMAKYFASEACLRVVNEAVQIHGGYGYIKEFPVEKFYRDAKLCTIGEGTSEIHRIIIANTLLNK